MNNLFFVNDILSLRAIACKHQMVSPETIINPVYLINPISTFCFVSQNDCPDKDIIPIFQFVCESVGHHIAHNFNEGIVLIDYFKKLKVIGYQNSFPHKYYAISYSKMSPGIISGFRALQTTTLLRRMGLCASNKYCLPKGSISILNSLSTRLTVSYSAKGNEYDGVSTVSEYIVSSFYRSVKNRGISFHKYFQKAIDFSVVPAFKNRPSSG